MRESHGNVCCVGRDTELNQLFEWHREAREERVARLAVISGPRGIGKSRLLSALRAKTRLSGGVVFEGRAERSVAFAPFAAIVAQAVRFLEEVGRPFDVGSAGLGCATGCHALWFQHQGAATALTDADFVRHREGFLDAIIALFSQVARVRAPIVLVHDLENADHGTLDLLSALLDAGSPFAADAERPLSALFATCVRSDAEGKLPERVSALMMHEATRKLALGALSEAGVRALLSSSEAVQQILERTGGSPDAIRRMLEATPPSADQHTRNLLDLLSTAARRVVFALAVRGRPATYDELERVLDTELDVATRKTLEEVDFLEVRRSLPRVELSFARDTEIVSVLGVLAAERQKELHLRWLDVLEELGADPAACTRHALQAGEEQRAVKLALLASANLSAKHAQHEAAELLEAVLDGTKAAHAVSLREELVQLYRATGEYRRGLIHARLLRNHRPDHAEYHRAVCDLLVQCGDAEGALEALREAHVLAEAQGEARVSAELEALLAEVNFRRGDHGTTMQWALRVLERGGDVPTRTLIAARNTLGKSALARGENDEAARMFEANCEAASEAGLVDLESQAWANLGFARLDRTHPRGVLHEFERALELATRAGDARRKAVATEALAVCAHLARDYRSAREHYQSTLVLLRRVNSPAMVVGAATNLGELYLSLGETRRAQSMCELSTQIGGARLSPTLRAEAMLLRGRIALSRGELESARASLEIARDFLRAQGDARIAEVELSLAEVELEAGDLQSARRRIGALAETGSPRLNAQLAIFAGALERALGGDTLGAAERAARLAELSADDEMRVPAYTLLARALADEAQPRGAKDAVERAFAAEKRLAKTVPEDLLGAWNERRARIELERVARRVGELPSQNKTAEARTTTARRSHVSEEQLGTWAQRYPKIIGRSPRMCDVLRVVDRAAKSDLQVLIRGESGTGKELIAEALHTNSHRRDKPFLRMNCAAIVESLLLSELFGHERGAFTGAAGRRRGRFEAAHGGTLFLDEIGDISPATQAALLRVLQEGEFERVGGTQTVKVDVRIIAATHRDLESMVRAGTFREDLYYRLRGITIEMPALRSRRDDLPSLCEHLLRKLSHETEGDVRLTDDALQAITKHEWPGNVRELENVLRSASLFAEDAVVGVEALRPLIPIPVAADPQAELEIVRDSQIPNLSDVDPVDPVYDRIRGGQTSLFEMKKKLERECIQRALRETSGNITRAAHLLGMKRPRLSQLVKEYELFSLAERL